MTFSHSQEPKETPEKCLCCATESILKAFVMREKILRIIKEYDFSEDDKQARQKVCCNFFRYHKALTLLFLRATLRTVIIKSQ